MQEHLQEELDKAGMTWEELPDGYRLPSLKRRHGLS